MDILNDKSNIRKLLKEECLNFEPSDELIDKLLEMAIEVRLKPKEMLIEEGKVNTSVYIVKEGLLRLFYFDGVKEETFGFAMEGTFFLSPYSYYLRKSAFIQTESCLESVVLKLSKDKFDALVRESHEFAEWAFYLSIQQIYSCEKKLFLISGSANDRYEALLRNRPELFHIVPMKVLASYLGITPQYLSYLRSSIYKNDQDK